MTFRADELVLSHDGRWLLCAREQLTRLSELASPASFAEFTSVHSAGGQRLAVTSNGQRVFAAGYDTGGVAAYNPKSGSLLWSRRDLRHAQSLRLTMDEELLVCGFERGPARVVSATTGEPREALRGVRHVCPLAPDVWLLVYHGKYVLRRTSGTSASLAAHTFAMLDCLLLKDTLWLSEAAGSVRAFSVGDGAQVWEYLPPADSHVLRLGVSAEGVCYGIEWPYKHGGMHRVVRLELGRAHYTTQLELSWPFALVPARSMAVLASTEVVRVITA